MLSKRHSKPVQYPRQRSTNQPHGKAVLVDILVGEYQRSQRYQKLSAGTKRRYQATFKFFDRFILYTNKNIYQMYAHKIDYSMVDYIHDVLAHTTAPATIRLHFTVMNIVWQLALRNGRVLMNPWARPGIKVDNERDYTWTPEQVKRAIQVSTEMGFHSLALYILVGYETGIRMWSDLRRLTWDMITEKDGVHTLDFRISKTGVHIMLPLPPTVIDALRAAGNTTGYLFKNNQGAVLKPVTISTQFQKIREPAGLGNELQLRDLRRTAVTELVEAGSTIPEIAAITGWKNPTSIINRYARIRFKTAENGMKKRLENRENIRLHNLSESSPEHLVKV